jgi:hypothetical protein
VELEVTPEPDEAERQAIELALERVETERSTGAKAGSALWREAGLREATGHADHP